MPDPVDLGHAISFDGADEDDRLPPAAYCGLQARDSWNTWRNRTSVDSDHPGGTAAVLTKEVHDEWDDDEDWSRTSRTSGSVPKRQAGPVSRPPTDRHQP